MEPHKTIAPISNLIFRHRVIFLLLPLMMISSSSCAAKLGNDTDQLALLEFKSLITDDPYGILSSWNKSRHHCQWRGVTCGHKHQRVTRLNLYKQNLFGPISPHIGNLTFLNSINLMNNRLYGEIPQEIGSLYRLRDIILANNTLGGRIPLILSNCTMLEKFSVGVNKLMGEIPASLSSLKKLVVLALDKNYLNGEIPISLGNLSSLQIFSVSYNNLQGSIPNELSELRSLTLFGIGVNNLSGIFPTSLYNISSLTKLSTGPNLLTGNLPSDLGSNLPNLYELWIDINQFTGTIPASIANASRLQLVDLSSNSFVGQVPTSIGLLSDLQSFSVEVNELGGNPNKDFDFLKALANCSHLEEFSIYSNNFTGKLPGSIADLSTRLNVLYVGKNKIYGPIPEAIGNLTSLYNLGMDENHFSGIIPSSLGQLKNLQTLDMDSNQLSGEIPSSLGNISQLGELTIMNNRLIGSMPESLGNCQKLQLLDLSNNNLTGTIPSQVIGISLQDLNLSQNSFSGPLPTLLGKAVAMNVLDVSLNYLSGEIPIGIGNCLSLESLNLRRNSFQGTIPSTLASLKGIKYIDLSQNNLSGDIPVELGSLSLQYLNLSFNDLEGDIPTSGVFGNASEISIFGNVKLCGGIPELGKPLCRIQTHKNHNIAFIFKLIIGLVCVGFFLTALISFGALYWRRKKRKDSTPASLREDKLMRVSYWELYKATDGFSSGNLIGSGSFGSVYRGKLNQQTSTLIAVKVLNLQNNRAHKSFMAECKILKNIRHRNLLKIMTYCSSIDPKHNEFKALVYEFLPNGNLDMWLHPDATYSSRTLSLLQRLDIAIDVACALQYLHSHCESPVVHCDLKPSNILLNDDMSACVGDFGLAKFRPKITGEISEMSSIGLRGSVGYAAPEYGTGSEVTTSGDIYSYGIILLEMMTGRRPTDDIFKEGLNLHNYVEKALPMHVNQVMDPCLYGEEQVVTDEEEKSGINNDKVVEMEANVKNRGSSCNEGNLRNCITSILKIGLACSQESPTQRMDMNDVTRELHRVKDHIL